MADPRAVLPENSTKTLKLSDIDYSITHRSVEVVCESDSPGLPSASQALAGAGGTGRGVDGLMRLENGKCLGSRIGSAQAQKGSLGFQEIRKRRKGLCGNTNGCTSLPHCERCDFERVGFRDLLLL